MRNINMMRMPVCIGTIYADKVRIQIILQVPHYLILMSKTDHKKEIVKND